MHLQDMCINLYKFKIILLLMQSNQIISLKLACIGQIWSEAEELVLDTFGAVPSINARAVAVDIGVCHSSVCIFYVRKVYIP